MKEEYKEMEMEVIVFMHEDIIVTSETTDPNELPPQPIP